MLGSCCAGICGSGGGASKAREVTINRGEKPGGSKVTIKPDIPKGEDYAPNQPTIELLESLGLVTAPPDATKPTAMVTANYPKNSGRLLILVPSRNAPLGVWDEALSGDRGAIVPLVRWAKANDFALAYFFADQFHASPSTVWDAVLKGSPARFVAIAMAGGALPSFQAGVAHLHPLLYSRVKSIMYMSHDVMDIGTKNVSSDVRDLCEKALFHIPAEWENMQPFAMHQCMFQLLEERVNRWAQSEMSKYAGFQNMKENDVPGVKRLTLDKRIERLDRDRDDDELAQILKKNDAQERSGVFEDEPGVD